MKKLLLNYILITTFIIESALLLMLSGCISENALAPAAKESHVYIGVIKQFLIQQEINETPVTITLEDSKGTFTARGKITFVDSMRMITETQGYLFPSDVSFDSAFAWTKTLQPVTIRMNGDSLSGNLPPDFLGFRFEFYTKR